MKSWLLNVKLFIVHIPPAFKGKKKEKNERNSHFKGCVCSHPLANGKKFVSN